MQYSGYIMGSGYIGAVHYCLNYFLLPIIIFRRSLSISANSSLSDDPNASIESIADIPITLINPRYSGEMKTYDTNISHTSESEKEDVPKRYDVGGKEKKDISSVRYYDGKDRDDASEREREDVRKRYDVGGKERDSSSVERLEVPRTPSGRRGIRSLGESTPLGSR